ncbi:MAG: hypothetical protein OXT69_13865 [Candidatus Poribacteria bacterium]|nr:hypothetical protein [Candidatus Poribacteria bacterium]
MMGRPKSIRESDFRAVRGNYQYLALKVLDNALRDAAGTRQTSHETQREAREFIHSKEAEFWADASGVNIRKLRQAYKQRLLQ